MDYSLERIIETLDQDEYHKQVQKMKFHMKRKLNDNKPLIQEFEALIKNNSQHYLVESQDLKKFQTLNYSLHQRNGLFYLFTTLASNALWYFKFSQIKKSSKFKRFLKFSFITFVPGLLITPLFSLACNQELTQSMADISSKYDLQQDKYISHIVVNSFGSYLHKKNQ